MGVGNPINLISGNKYQREVDLPALPGVLGLELVRHYNSDFSKPGDANGIIGRGWRLSYETDLYVRGDGLHILQADGSRLIFDRDPNDPSIASGTDPSRGRITIRHTSEGPEYTWHWPEGRQLLFNTQGRLVQILAPTGEFVTLRRAPNGNLLQVTDPQGRSLHLRYLDRASVASNDRYKGVQAIDTPVGEFRYEYGAEPPPGSDVDSHMLRASLARVHLPTHYDHDKKRSEGSGPGTTTSTVVRHYHYEDPRHPTLLTGISVRGAGSDGRVLDERVASWEYDASGKAIKAVKGRALKQAGDDELATAGTIEYVDLDRSVPGRTTVRDHLGRTTIYRHAVIAGEYRLLEGRGPGCASCPESNVRYRYDRQGRVSAITRLDDTGAPIETTTNELDGAGRITSIIRMPYKNGKPSAPQVLSAYRYTLDPKYAAPRSVTITRPSVEKGHFHQVRVDYNETRQPVRIHEAGWRPSIEGKEPAPIERITRIDYANRNGRSVVISIRVGAGDYEETTDIEYDERGSFPVRIRTHGGKTLEFVERYPDGRPRRIRTDDEAGALLTEYEYLPGGDIKAAVQTALHEPKGAPVRRKLEVRHDALARLVEMHLPSHVRRIAFAAPDSGSPDADLSVVTTSGEVDDTQHVRGETGSIAEREVLGLMLPDAAGTNPNVLGRRWLDDFGRLVAFQYRGQGIARAEYVGFSHRLRTVTDPAGAVTRLHRDKQGRLVSLERYDVAGARQDRVDFRYAGHHLIEQRRQYGTGRRMQESVIRRTYNLFGQVIEEYQQHGGDSYTVHNDYDDAGKLISTRITEHNRGGMTVRLPEIRFRYQERAELGHRLRSIEAVSGWFGSKDVVRALNWLVPAALSRQTSAADDGILTGWQYGNGLAARSTYQHDGQSHVPNVLLTHENGVHSWRIASEADGRILGIAPLVAGQEISSAKAQVSGRMHEISGSIQLRDDLLHSMDAVDSAGRRLVHRRHNSDYALRWNIAGELEQVEHEGRQVASYRYDAEGRRTSKTVPGQPAETRHFIYSGDRLVAEADEQGRIFRQYLHIGWRPVAWIEPGRGLFGKVREFFQGPKLIYLHTDHRGAVTAATAEDKTMLWQARADAHGNLMPLPVKGKFIEQPLRMVNQYADDETGLHYNLARYYDPTTGNFLTPDPAGFDAGYMDLYAYGNGDMWNLVDPDAWAAITYYLIDTARNDGNAQRGQYRWSFWIRDIGTDPGLNILYDKGGSFIRANDDAASSAQGRPAHISWRADSRGRQNVHQQFIDTYVNDMISPDSFTMQIDDAAAMQIMDDLKRHGDVIRKYYDCRAGAAPGTERKLVLPPAKLRTVTLHPGGVVGERDEPGGTRVDQGEDALDCRQAMTPEQAFQRLKRAIQIKESGNKDCSRDGCPARVWNPSGVPASYGPTQFVVSTFLDRLLKSTASKERLKSKNIAYLSLYEGQSRMTEEELRALGFTDAAGRKTELENRIEDGLLRSLHVVGGYFKGRVIVGWKNILNAHTPISPADPEAVSKFAMETGFAHTSGSRTSEAYNMYVRMVRWHQLINDLNSIKLKTGGSQSAVRDHFIKVRAERRDEYQKIFEALRLDRLEKLDPYLRVQMWNEGWQGFATAAALKDPSLKRFLIDDKNAMFRDKSRFDIVSDREIRWRYAKYRAEHQGDTEVDIATRVAYTHNTGAAATNLKNVFKLAYARDLAKIWDKEHQSMSCHPRHIRRLSLDPR